MDWGVVSILSIAIGGIIAAGILIARGAGAAQVVERLTDVERAARAAREIVAAVEQLYQTGNLTADERLDYAADKLTEVFPQLSPDLIRLAIEAAVHWRNLAAGEHMIPKPGRVEQDEDVIEPVLVPTYKIDYGQRS